MSIKLLRFGWGEGRGPVAASILLKQRNSMTWRRISATNTIEFSKASLDSSMVRNLQREKFPG